MCCSSPPPPSTHTHMPLAAPPRCTAPPFCTAGVWAGPGGPGAGDAPEVQRGRGQGAVQFHGGAAVHPPCSAAAHCITKHLTARLLSAVRVVRVDGEGATPLTATGAVQRRGMCAARGGRLVGRGCPSLPPGGGGPSHPSRHVGRPGRPVRAVGHTPLHQQASSCANTCLMPPAPRPRCLPPSLPSLSSLAARQEHDKKLATLQVGAWARGSGLGRWVARPGQQLVSQPVQAVSQAGGQVEEVQVPALLLWAVDAEASSSVPFVGLRAAERWPIVTFALLLLPLLLVLLPSGCRGLARHACIAQRAHACAPLPASPAVQGGLGRSNSPGPRTCPGPGRPGPLPRPPCRLTPCIPSPASAPPPSDPPTAHANPHNPTGPYTSQSPPPPDPHPPTTPLFQPNRASWPRAPPRRPGGSPRRRPWSSAWRPGRPR